MVVVLHSPSNKHWLSECRCPSRKTLNERCRLREISRSGTKSSIMVDGPKTISREQIKTICKQQDLKKISNLLLGYMMVPIEGLWLRKMNSEIV